MNSDLEIPDKHPIWNAPDTKEEVARFLGESDRREVLPKAVFLREGTNPVYEYATNGAAAYRGVPGSKPLEACPVKTERAEMIDEALDTARKGTRSATVSFESLVGAFLELPTEEVREKRTCHSCGGDGWCECTSCGNKHRCEVCNGRGDFLKENGAVERLRYPRINDYFNDDGVPVEVYGHYFKPLYLELLLGIGGSEITLTVTPKEDLPEDVDPYRETLHAQSGGSELAIMPYLWNPSRHDASVPSFTDLLSHEVTT